MTIRVIEADMRDALRDMAKTGERFHACVCDPPYHLTSIVKRFGKASLGDDTQTSDRVRAGADGYARSARGFMGKTWDGGDIAFQVETWRAVYDVLLPGAYLLAFGGTRTYHRLVCAIEDAGFEIRDATGWLFGSGFPKSHDVSKGIDKARVEDIGPVRAVCRALRAAMDARSLKSTDLIGHFNGCHSRLIDHWAARDTDSQPALPTPEQWGALRLLYPELAPFDAEVWRLNGRKGKPGDVWQTAEVVGEYEGEPGGFGEHRFSVRDSAIRAPSPEAAVWQGWGTALKPAMELICVARKPLIGSVAANVLAHGTGAMNIDACRVWTAENLNGGAYAAATRSDGTSGSMAGGPLSNAIGAEFVQPAGRWPANVIHDGSPEVEEAFAAFGDKGGGFGVRGGNKSRTSYGFDAGTGETVGFGDSGSASRFFYSTKADKDDRAGSGHPTVKPIDLLEYLVRLVTAKGGHVLDPFAGSGTTGEACMKQGFDCTLIERDPTYANDIRHRIKRWSGLDTPLFATPAEAAE